MGFWDNVLKDKKKYSREKDRDEDENLKKLLEEQKIAEDMAAKQTAEENARKQAEAEARKEAEIEARKEAARLEQDRLAEANRLSVQQRTVINPNTIRQTVVPSPENVISKSLNLSSQEEEEDILIKYVDPTTGRVYYVKKGETPPSGTIPESDYRAGRLGSYNVASTAISRAQANADKLLYGKKALEKSKDKGWRGGSQTLGLAMSARKRDKAGNLFSEEQLTKLDAVAEWKRMNTVQKRLALDTMPDTDGDMVPDAFDFDPNNYMIRTNSDDFLGGKYAMGKSKGKDSWTQGSRGLGRAKSAGKYELSNVFDITKLNKNQLAMLEKETIWKNMTDEEQMLARISLPDKDGDLVPDEYDSFPNNKNRIGFSEKSLGGNRALQQSNKGQRTIITGKGRLKQAVSKQGPKNMKGKFATEALVGNILNVGSGKGNKGFKFFNSTDNINNKIFGKGNSNGNNNGNIGGGNTGGSVVKSKSNGMYSVNLLSNGNSYTVQVLGIGGMIVNRISNLSQQNANKTFNQITNQYGV